MKRIKLSRYNLMESRHQANKRSKSSPYVPSKSWVFRTDQAGEDDGQDVTLETASPILDDGCEKSPLRGELDSAVNHYLDQVRGLGYKDSIRSSQTQSFKDDTPIYQVSTKSKSFTKKNISSPKLESKNKVGKKQSLKEQSRKNAELLYRFHRRSRSIERFERQPIITDDLDDPKPLSKHDLLSVQFQLTDDELSQDEILEYEDDNTADDTPSPIAHDNPLYLNLQDCSSGLIEDSPEHYYENGSFGGSEGDNDHIYENVENSEHVYDTVPKRPGVPPKPDFLSQLAARQSEPIKKAWNPFVNSEIEEKSIDNKELLYSNIEISKKKNRVKLTEDVKRCTNPFRTDHPIGTSEQTIVIDGSETSDLGSSGEDSASVEEWPLPPTPLPGTAETSEGESPLPPPPPELALQQLEEQVLKEEEEERLYSLQRQKHEIQTKYKDKPSIIPNNNFDDNLNAEAVNSKFANLNEAFNNTVKSNIYSENCALKEEENDPIKFVSSTETSDSENDKKHPRIIEIETDLEDFDTPAIRHSVIIALKDSCSLALKPSQIKRKESIKRGASLRRSGILKRTNSDKSDGVSNTIIEPSYSNVNGNYSDLEGEFSFVTQFSEPNLSQGIIEISEDGSWATKGSMDNETNMKNMDSDIDPFTGRPIPVPPPRKVSAEHKEVLKSSNTQSLNDTAVKEIVIAAPPENFQGDDGLDGVFSAACVSTFSGPSSLASNFPDHFGDTHDSPSINGYSSLIPCRKKILSAETSDYEDIQPNSTSNIGTAIMESYERDIKKKKDSMNLPEVSLLEFGDSVKDLEHQRRSVIKQMTVKAKKKDSWIKTCRMHDQGSTEVAPTAPCRSKRKCNEDDQNISIEVEENQFSLQDRANIFLKNASKTERSIVYTSEQNTDGILAVKENETLNKNVTTTSIIQMSNSTDKTIEKSSIPIHNIVNTINKSTTVHLQTSPCSKITQSNRNKEILTSMVKDKNEMNTVQNLCSPREIVIHTKINKGDVATAAAEPTEEISGNYWESDELSPTMEGDQGWETVANVRFQQQEKVDSAVAEVAPPPEFIAAPPPQFDNSPPPSLESIEQKIPQQYVYGIDDVDDDDFHLQQNESILRVVETTAKKPATQENIIESEIREHQKRELILRQENESLRINTRDKGATSPASHDSDEGFVDRHPVEDLGSTPPLVDTPPLAPSPTVLEPPEIVQDYNHTLRGNHVEQAIFDTVVTKAIKAPVFNNVVRHSTSASSSESKIAMEIRELREREEELRIMRERLTASREDILEEEGGRSEDVLTSLTCTTDEGNYSECGETASSEDKSSDGSNSRMMSPDLQPSFAPRKSVSVKPYQEDDEEDQPVYTRMKKESVIEREIRMAREREDAFRREKSLISMSSIAVPAPRSSPRVQSETSSKENRIFSSKILQENNQIHRERDVIGGVIQETVDVKVNRLIDLVELSSSEGSPRPRPSSSSSMSSDTSSRPSLSSPVNPPITPINKRSQSPMSPTYSPFSPPAFTPSPTPLGSSRLTRSLSTNNLSTGANPGGIRAPRGLMQKFIASRGKLSTSAFGSSPTNNGCTPVSTSVKGVAIRPMRVEPKASGLRHPQIPSPTPTVEAPKSSFRRANLSAEEKIQEELKEMQRREEELRRERARNLAQSQPNLLDFEDDIEEEIESSGTFTEGFGNYVTTSAYKQEVNLRAAHSNPNLLDDDIEQSPGPTLDKSARRRSTLIAQWENRIQQTADT